MIYKSLIFRYIFIATFLFSASNAVAQPSVEEGKTLFRNKCATCHARDMKTESTGPALAGFKERWEDYPIEDLYTWVINSQTLISEGHPRAVELWDQYKPTVMQANPDLTNEQIESIFAYIEEAATAPTDVSTTQHGAETQAGEGISNYLYWLLLVILVVLSIILARIISNLNQLAATKEGVHKPRKTFLEILTSKNVISFALFALVVLGGYTTVNNAMNMGRQQGYAPEQPIKFSHETHSGIHQIDCQYCHDGARRSKHSVIPGANTCMNCHMAIKVGSVYGTAELTKIYASIGYDPRGVGQYIEGYEELSEEEIEEIYKTWISEQYLEQEGVPALGPTGTQIVEEQWEGIVKSLTNKQKKQIPGPIEWIRVHNLPDHVYFNHSQHVKVGQVECQTCHGKVEEMAVVQQFATQSMGWCVNCHRQTEVQFTGNEYYESYTKYHEELSSGAKDRVTVEDIGGIECQKCHY